MESKKREKEIRVLMGIPRAGFSQVEAVDNQIDMALFLGKYCGLNPGFKIYSATIGRIFVAKARDEFAKYAIKTDCDYLFMVDDDMICPTNLLLTLMSHDKDIVAPLAFQRREPYYPVIYKQREGYDPARKERYHANEIVKAYPKDKLVECDAVGFGAVLIKRWVLDKMKPPLFMSTSPSGEDILFCYRARQELGARVFVDTRTKIQHLGVPTIVDESVYESHNNMEKVREYTCDPQL